MNISVSETSLVPLPATAPVELRITPARRLYLNKRSGKKRNLYFLSYSALDRDFVHPGLSAEFNLISLYYDLHNCHRVKNGTAIVMKQLEALLSNDKDAVVLGHSFNGYVAYQLACVLPQVSHCVMIDTSNEFLREQYKGKNRLLSLAANLYRQLIKNGDPGYPASLVRLVFRDLVAPKGDDHSDVRKGAFAFFREVTHQPALNNCLFIKASRSCMSNPLHGYNWEPFVAGKFELRSFPADHVEIKKFDAEIAVFILEATHT